MSVKLHALATVYLALATTTATWAQTSAPAPADQTPAPTTASTPATVTPAAAAAPAAPTALSTPAITGPLANLPPAIFDAGPLGKLSVNGFLSGIGFAQNNHVPGDKTAQAALSNGPGLHSKDRRLVSVLHTGWCIQHSGAGNILPVHRENHYRSLRRCSRRLCQVPNGKNTNIEVGYLPTLIGAEYTFTFENMNVERGLLWNQENAVNRGIQINQTMGKFAASLSWNDGFFSDRYTWLSGSLAYTNGAHALSFVAMGNLGQTKFQNLATPVQNNGSIYNVIYTYTKGAWIIQPYYQYTRVPTNNSIGIAKGASTNGGAILASYAFKHGFSLPVRFEYISSSGSAAQNTVNLLYGAGSSGTSFTVTPTYQAGGFFARGDVSYTYAGKSTPGFVFGNNGNKDNQSRAAVEVGYVFGNNIVEKK